jgi:uncharacterized protein
MPIGRSIDCQPPAIRWGILLMLVLGLGTRAAGQIPADKLLQSLNPTAAVNDYAGILSPEQKATLEDRCHQLRAKTGAALVVVTLKSLQGGQIDDFAVKLFKQRGIGQKGKNNGVLLLVALEDRKARIEVGYGLEPILPDALAGRILDQQLFPAFKQQRYYDGLQAAVTRIAEIIERNEPASASDRGEGFSLEAAFALVVFLGAFVAAGGFMLGRGAGLRHVPLIFSGLLAAGLPFLADCGMGQSWALPLHVPIGLLLAWLGWRSSKEDGLTQWPGWTNTTSDPWIWTGTSGGWGDWTSGSSSWGDWSSGGSGGFSGGDWGGFGGGSSGGGGASGGW